MYCLQNKLISLPVMLLVAILCNSASLVASEQKPSTIDIKSHYLLLDDKKGVSKYIGDVVLSKDTLLIKADTVTLYYKDQQLVRALITGTPADVQHEPDNEAKVHSQAHNMEYLVKEDRLVLKGKAFVDQGNRHFSGEYIEYDTRQRIITAAGNQNGTSNTGETTVKNTKNHPPSGRVHVIIGPTEE